MQATVKINGFEMKYCCFGKGERALIIIPGLSLTPVTPLEDFLVQLYTPFLEDHKIYVFDRRENAPEGYTIEQMADDTAAVMKDLGISGADVFGASQGGMIAMGIAIRHPELVGKLIVGSSASKPNTTTENMIGSWIGLAEKKQGMELQEAFLCGVYSEKSVAERGDAIRATFIDVSDEMFKQFITVAKPILTYNCYDELGKIQCPVLVLGSWGDRVLGPQASLQIAEKLGCECHMYPRTYGHGVYDEAPDYISRISAFLEL